VKTKRIHKKVPYEKNRDRQLRCRYGITLIEYTQMLVAQQGVCFICKQPPKRQPLYVDHNHTTGAIRKLLCAECNRAVAHAEREENFLWKVIQYTGGNYEFCT
jgi:hypothetical protein